MMKSRALHLTSQLIILQEDNKVRLVVINEIGNRNILEQRPLQNVLPTNMRILERPFREREGKT